MHRPDASSRGLYWFVTAKGGFSTVGYPVTPEIEAATLDTVGRIVDGIAAGHFPLTQLPRDTGPGSTVRTANPTLSV